MDLTSVAVELYTLAPSEFTAARNARAKEARAAGDAELARRISRIPKASTAAWAINMLARHRPAEIDSVVDLGTDLLKAQQEQDRSGLRELGQQRSRVLASAVREARGVAEGLGVKVSEAAADEVGDTLRAAMADPQAADAVRSGQLVRALSSNGLEPVDLEGALAVPEALGMVGLPETEVAAPDVGGAPLGEGQPAHEGAKQRQSAQQRREDKQRAEDRRREEQAKREEARKREEESKREELRAAAEEAERNADEAEADLAEAESQLEEAVSRRDHLNSEIAAAKDRLAALEEDLAAAERFARIAEKNHKLAGRLAAQERQNAQRERERLDQLRS